MDASFSSFSTIHLPHQHHHRHSNRTPFLTLPPRHSLHLNKVSAGTTDHGKSPIQTEPTRPSPPRRLLLRRETTKIATTERGKMDSDDVNSDQNDYGEKTASSSSSSSSSSLMATLCNALEDMINNFLEPPLRPSSNPKHVLAGNFAPVDELPPTSCPVVKGSIPVCLRGGAYIRNGPNPRHYHPTGPYHLFFGDGMLHSILLPPAAGDGRSSATLSSRYIRTYKYTLESEADTPVIPNFFSFYSIAGVARSFVAVLRVLTGQINYAEGFSGVNTSLAFFGNRLFAFGEPDLPYEVHVSPDDGDVSTVGRCNFEGKLFKGMAAHPKKDPDTGELFAFRYGLFVPPYLTYFWFDRDGNKQPDVPIFSLPGPYFFHDFTITKRYVIVPDGQMVVRPLGMVLFGKSLVRSDPRKVSRVGVLPKYAKSGVDMRWFDVPGFNPMHTLNAWEEGDDAIVLVACNVLSVEHLIERMELTHSCVEMVRIDLKNGTVSRTPLSVGNLDAGVINPAYLGKRNRYAYLAIGGPFPRITGVAKLDFELAEEEKDCLVASRRYGPGCFGGEPFFVAKGETGDEDDGYLLSFVHNENNGVSKLVVMDAKSPELEIVAEVLLPQRVPYGFHGLFVSEEDLKNQRH